MQLTWLGAAGFKIETSAGAIILINPFLSRPPQATPLLSLQLADLSPVDEILLTDSRFVFAMDTPALVKNTGAIVHAPPQVCRHLRETGVSGNNLEPITPHKTKTVARLRWQAWSIYELKHNFTLPEIAANSPLPGLIENWPPTQTVSYTLQTDGVSIIHIGNTDWIDPELEGLQPDIALLPANPTTIQQTIQLAAKLKPAIIIPHYWDNFYPPLTHAVDLAELKNTVQTNTIGSTIFWPTPGQTFNMSHLL